MESSRAMTLITSKIPKLLNSMPQPLEVPGEFFCHGFPLVVLSTERTGEEPRPVSLDRLDLGTESPEVLAGPEAPWAAPAAYYEFHVTT